MKFSLLLVIPFFLLLVTGRSQNITPSEKVVSPPVYPKIRIWTTPSMGEEPKFNSPSLQWPTKKKGTYSVRISSSKDFTRDLIEKAGIPYAIFNPHKTLGAGIWYWQHKANDEKWNETDSFTIKSSMRLFETPDIKTIMSGISSGHPRILIKKEELPEFRIRAKAGYYFHHLQPAKPLLLRRSAGLWLV